MLDIATGWEEGGTVRVYRNPGPSRTKERWPSMTVGNVGSPEDAVFFDADGDGDLDVVSASEGKTRSLNVHWNEGESWRTEAIADSVGRMQWMYSAPLGRQLVSGGKNEGAELGIWSTDWKWTPLRPVGWIMSIVPADMDGDGDLDILFSDRRGPRSGVYWLENGAGWREHAVGSVGREAMFLRVVNGDVLVAVKRYEIHRHKKAGGTEVIATPSYTGGVKAVNGGDLDGDGALDLVYTCEGTPEGQSGVMAQIRGEWVEISGWPGIKYDLVELIDLDGDGDLDVLTCEETTGLGVVWFENPFKGTEGAGKPR